MDPSASLLELRFTLPSSVRIRPDDKIAFESRSGCVVELNDLGFILMKAAEASLPVAAVMEALAIHYQTSAEVVAVDAAEFYEHMVKRGFLLSQAMDPRNG